MIFTTKYFFLNPPVSQVIVDDPSNFHSSEHVLLSFSFYLHIVNIAIDCEGYIGGGFNMSS